MPMTAEQKYQLVQSFLFDASFYQSAMANAEQALQQQGVTDAPTQQELIAIFNQLQMGNQFAALQNEETKKMNEVMQFSMLDTMETANSFKASIRNTLQQINTGYKVVMGMYMLAFITGVGLVIAAIVMAITKQQQLLSIVFGSLGTLEILVFFFTKPPLQLQSSRIRHAQLEMAFYSWFVDVYNINSYFVSLNGKMDDPAVYERFKEMVDKQLTHTKETLQALKDFTASTTADV
jgi:hypothetical protein